MNFKKSAGYLFAIFAVAFFPTFALADVTQPDASVLSNDLGRSFGGSGYFVVNLGNGYSGQMTGASVQGIFTPGPGVDGNQLLFAIDQYKNANLVGVDSECVYQYTFDTSSFNVATSGTVAIPSPYSETNHGCTANPNDYVQVTILAGDAFLQLQFYGTSSPAFGPFQSIGSSGTDFQGVQIPAFSISGITQTGTSTQATVPLWTQVQSNFPSDAQTKTWFNQPYASGIDHQCARNRPGFAATIGDCGCLITSFVMLAHYYGINNDVDGNNVTPLTMNNWLTTHNGYANVTHNELNPINTTNENLLDWNKIPFYLGTPAAGGKTNVLMSYAQGDTSKIKITSPTTLDSYLAAGDLAIAYNAVVGHYVVVSSKVTQPTSTYAIRDPFFYNTQTLNDTQNSSTTHAYNNLYKYVVVPQKLSAPQLATAYTTLYLASPAEFLVTDPQGNKVGKDPATNAVYNQIAGADYDITDPIVTSDTALDPSALPHTKVLYLPTLANGTYDVKVIGTGTGTYQFTAAMTTDTGTTTTQVYTASTSPNQVTRYTLSVVNGTQSISQDLVPPEVSVAFSTSTSKIIISGTDDQSVPSVVTTATSSTITDASGNTLVLKLTNSTAQPNYAALTIPSIVYSTGTTTNATTTLRYFWATDSHGAYTFFISALKTPTTREIAIYTPLTNKTYVVTSTAADDTADLSFQTALLLLRPKLQTYTGLYIPSIFTRQGSVVIK